MQHPRLAIAAVITAANLLATGPTGAATMSNLPPEATQGAVTYRTGGVGESEAMAMRHAEAKYPLSLEFVQRAYPKDEYLAYADVTIKDHAGNTMLKAMSDGPYLLAKLPNGHYTVMATENGKTETRHIVVAAHKPDHLVFVW